MKKKIYPLLENPYRKKDLNAAIEVINTGRITIGPKTKEFEKLFCKKIKTKNSLMVNSGSSANLLALQCLINPYRKQRLKIGDKVLLPAICWATTLWPIIQSGLKPVFVDIDPYTLNIDLNDLRKKISKKTKAIMAVHVLGNSTNMDQFYQIIKKNKLILIEDTCESLGSKFRNKYLGTFGDFSTFSFYSSHQISSGEGGMICAKSKEDMEILRALRSHGWSRGLAKEKQIAKKFKKIDKRFIFYNSGFNLRPTDICASIGLSQFKNIDQLQKIRNKNRDLIVNTLKKSNIINDNLHFIEKNKNVNPAWFGIPILVTNKNKKEKLINGLENDGVETRPIISGNFLKQPAIKKYKILSTKNYKNADYVNDRGFFIGLPSKKIAKNLLKKLVNSFEKYL